MNVTVSKAYRLAEESGLPVGRYEGIWSGCLIHLRDGWLLIADHGVRGHCACHVNVAEDLSVSITVPDDATRFPLPEDLTPETG